ncbi:hypothetical protein [Tsukamurella soli]|uniref:Uncharacterized protein n=1 Tax=Tsukamurella soli TaxID=644556 RepID=A0ABP8J3I3_9ACTN
MYAASGGSDTVDIRGLAEALIETLDPSLLTFGSGEVYRAEGEALIPDSPDITEATYIGPGQLVYIRSDLVPPHSTLSRRPYGNGDFYEPRTGGATVAFEDLFPHSAQ